jgi:hypothetical protein
LGDYSLSCFVEVRKQRVQSTAPLTFCKFGRKNLLVWRWEWETFEPTTFCFPQIEQIAIYVLEKLTVFAIILVYLIS